MAIFFSDEELLSAIQEMADKGALVTTGWTGFHAITGHNWSPPQTEAMRLSFWAGARCIFDALHRLDYFKADPQARERLTKLMRELGNDPFCRPPNQETMQ